MFLIDCVELHPNLALAGLVQELLVYCSNRSHGCQETIRLESLLHHLKECSFTPTNCPHGQFGCEFKGVSNQIQEHLSACEYEKIKGFINFITTRIAALESTVAAQAQLIDSLQKSVQTSQDGDSVDNNHSAAIASSSSSSSSQWPLGEIACRKTLGPFRTGVTSLYYNTGLLYAGFYDGSTQIFNSSTGASMAHMKGHNLSVWSLAVHQPTGRFFSAGSDAIIKVWDTSSVLAAEVDEAEDDPRSSPPGSPVPGLLSQQAPTLQQHLGKVYSLVMSNNTLFSASSDKTIKIWDAQSLECLGTMTGHTSGINSIVLRGGGGGSSDPTLISASNDHTIKLWDVSTSQVIHTIEGIDSEILDVCFGDGMIFASTYDARIIAFDANSGSQIATMLGHAWEVWKLNFSQGAIFSGSFDHTIKRWDVRQFEETATLLGHKVSRNLTVF